MSPLLKGRWQRKAGLPSKAVEGVAEPVADCWADPPLSAPPPAPRLSPAQDPAIAVPELRLDPAIAVPELRLEDPWEASMDMDSDAGSEVPSECCSSFCSCGTVLPEEHECSQVAGRAKVRDGADKPGPTGKPEADFDPRAAASRQRTDVEDRCCRGGESKDYPWDGSADERLRVSPWLQSVFDGIRAEVAQESGAAAVRP